MTLNGEFQGFSPRFLWLLRLVCWGGDDNCIGALPACFFSNNCDKILFP